MYTKERLIWLARLEAHTRCLFRAHVCHSLGGLEDISTLENISLSRRLFLLGCLWPTHGRAKWMSISMWDIHIPQMWISASLRVYAERVTMASRPVPLSWSLGGIPELAVPELCSQKQDWGGGDFALKCTVPDLSMSPCPFCLQCLLKRSAESRHTDIPTRSQAGEWGLGVILRSFYLLVSPFQNLVVSGLSGLHDETLSQTNERINKQTDTHHQPPPMRQRKIWK